ncbi:unnamed protein product [Linum tenue]|uniref:AP2/ERF domain-containing protein n=1 Tax=Linum tenue TaxID=586396 RepID=A0AAV0RG46_9ROSI|nr:unnamed protein product [Linum tenue]
MSSDGGDEERKYKGVRRRKWGKWVSEIRVPGSQERLWLGSYSSPEAAAVAHDIASYCLRGGSSQKGFNFPVNSLPASVRPDMSPRSVQRAASDAGMAVDAQMILRNSSSPPPAPEMSSGTSWGGGGGGGRWDGDGAGSSAGGDLLNVSVEDYF